MTSLAAQPFVHFGERKVIAQTGDELRHAQPRTVPALAALRAVVVRVVDITEFGGFEASVFHGRTVEPTACGSLLYKSYSSGHSALLYKRARCAVTPCLLRFRHVWPLCITG